MTRPLVLFFLFFLFSCLRACACVFFTKNPNDRKIGHMVLACFSSCGSDAFRRTQLMGYGNDDNVDDKDDDEFCD